MAVIDVPPAKAAGACKPHYRTLWISDVHLGTRDSKAAQLLERHAGNLRAAINASKARDG